MKLALGTVQFGLNYGVANASGQIKQDEVGLILQSARAHGIDTLDTAVNYGDSERFLGKCGVTDFSVISKLPAYPVGTKNFEQWVTDAIHDCLERLQTSSLSGLLLHRPEQLHGEFGEELYRALIALKEQGLIKKIGASIYDPSELEPLTRRFHLDIVQAPFNVLDRRLLASGWIKRLQSMNIELHVRSVFLQGLLLMPAAKRPKQFERWSEIWRHWDQWIANSGLNALQICLRDALAQGGITRVIVGVDSLLQLEQITLAAQGPAAEVSEILKCDDIDLINPARWEKL